MLKKFILVAFAVSFSFFAPTSSYANPPLRPGGGVTNAFTPCGGAMPKGVFGIVGNYINAKKDKVWIDGSSYQARNEATFNLFAVKPRYGLGNGWDIRALIPFITSDFSAIPAKNGVGDSVLILRKQVLSQANNFPVSVGVGFGPLIPTGSTDYDGLGTGAWGVHSELGITYAFDGGRQVIEGTLIYQWLGDGESKNQAGITTEDIDQNDAIRAHARYAIALTKNWDVGIEVIYDCILESKIDSKGQDNGSVSLFAGPAVRFKMPQWKASVGISPQFAVYQDYEAAHRMGGGPSSETFRMEAQFQKVF